MSEAIANGAIGGMFASDAVVDNISMHMFGEAVLSVIISMSDALGCSEALAVRFSAVADADIATAIDSGGANDSPFSTAYLASTYDDGDHSIVIMIPDTAAMKEIRVFRLVITDLHYSMAMTCPSHVTLI